MKKISLAIILSLLCAFGVHSLAAEEQHSEPFIPQAEETTVDASNPRLMLTGCKLSEASLSPSKTATLEIYLKNFSNTKALYNIKLTLSDESGDVKTTGVPTAYVNCIYAGGTYTWKVELTAAKTAAIGEHKLTVTSEYEDKYYMSYSGSDTVTVNITQTVGLSYDGAELPAKVIQGDTQTVAIKMMNTGKTDLRNCKADFSIDGMTSGGSLFIGEIPAGESKEGSINLRVSSEMLGETKGKVTISYEDIFGESYSETKDISTTIEKRVEVATPETKVEEKKQNDLWWLFLLIGIIAGGASGFGIPMLIRAKKQRKEDDLRL